MKKKRLAVIVVIFVLIFNISAFAETKDPFDYAREVYEFIQENYNGEIDNQVLADNLLKGITESLDEYSFAYDIEEKDIYLSGLTGEYEGIGISFSIINDLPKVMAVFKDTPAYKSGIVPNDVIIQVDGESTKSLTIQQIRNMITGKKGTSVTLTIQRKNTEDTIEISLVREEIQIKSVNYEIIEDNVGYLEISQFVEGTYKEVKEALEYFDERRIRKVILDLRDNPGGIVRQAVMVASEFVPKGTVTRLDFSNPDSIDYKYTSSLENKKYQLRVLVNENSASASEILTAAIKERSAGMIIGENTFGKGVFQNGYSVVSYEKYIETYNESNIEIVLENDYYKNSISLSEEDMGGYIQFTTGNYLTPNGNNLQGIGIEPDVIVEHEETENEVRYINRLSDSYLYEAGSDELIIANAKRILNHLGYYENEFTSEYTDEFRLAVSQFQRNEGIIANGELNNITKMGLDFHLEELKIEKDPQLNKALQLLE